MHVASHRKPTGELSHSEGASLRARRQLWNEVLVAVRAAARKVGSYCRSNQPMGSSFTPI
jgi:hypothetical protein